MEFKTLDDLEGSGKRALVRVDFNMPVDKDGNIINDQRIELTLPTFRELISKGMKIIVMTHFKRPKGKVIEEFRVDRIAKRFSELLGREVRKLGSSTGQEVSDAIRDQQDEIIFLENIQFDPRETENSDELGRELASYADAFVLDAFGQAHRNYASLVSIQKHIPSYAGRLVEQEIRELSIMVEAPEQPVVCIIGGAKEDKIRVIESLIGRGFTIIIGGMLANTFLKAQGVDIKSSRYYENTLPLASDILSKHRDSIMLPVDVVAGSEFSEHAEARVCSLHEVPDGWMILDIGPETIRSYSDTLRSAKTVFWGGPIGVFEWEQFQTGTREIARTLAESGSLSIIGGGESATAVINLGFADKMHYVSSGGGASMKFLAGRPLPAIQALCLNSLPEMRKQHG